MNVCPLKNKIGFFAFFALWASNDSIFAIDLTLKNEFINRYRNRATIDTSFIIDKAHKRPNPGAADGDLHVAGRATKEVGLPIVAEIMNAASQKEAVAKIHAVEGTDQKTPLTGVWRLWSEHGGTEDQVQDQDHDLAAFNTTNPDHVFEIHPITNLDGRSLLASLHRIQNYQKPAKNTKAAFEKYESLQSRIEILKNQDAIKVTTSMAGYNYVEFRLRPLGAPFALESNDGTAVFAEVHESDGELLVHKRRMIFIKNSAPEKALKSLKPNEDLHVLAVPRISLDLIAWRRDNYDKDQKYSDALDWGLPYEMVVVGHLGTIPYEEQ